MSNNHRLEATSTVIGKVIQVAGPAVDSSIPGTSR